MKMEEEQNRSVRASIVFPAAFGRVMRVFSQLRYPWLRWEDGGGWRRSLHCSSHHQPRNPPFCVVIMTSLPGAVHWQPRCILCFWCCSGAHSDLEYLCRLGGAVRIPPRSLKVTRRELQGDFRTRRMPNMEVVVELISLITFGFGIFLKKIHKTDALFLFTLLSLLKWKPKPQK